MKVTFSLEAWNDYIFWQKNSKTTLNKINELIKEIIWSPFSGKGKPEPLRYELQGFWSRRIDLQNRLVYRITDNDVEIVSVRFHYE